MRNHIKNIHVETVTTNREIVANHLAYTYLYMFLVAEIVMSIQPKKINMDEVGRKITMSVQTKKITMDEILAMEFNFGALEENELHKISIGFKKVVNTAQYETETFDINMEMKIPKSLSGIELELVYAISVSQLEYGILSKLFLRGGLTDTDFKSKKEKIENYVSSTYLKALTLGKEINYIKGLSQ